MSETKAAPSLLEVGLPPLQVPRGPVAGDRAGWWHEWRGFDGLLLQNGEMAWILAPLSEFSPHAPCPTKAFFFDKRREGAEGP